MKYHLYFHNDFDGVASGAVMLNFLHSRGYDIVSFSPINFSPKLKPKWPSHRFKKPFILVDFLYHPRAAWWFDHHETSFINEKWRKRFKNDRHHVFNPARKSACDLIRGHLKLKFNYKPPKHIANLAKWATKIDSASYKSAKEALWGKQPYIKLALAINPLNFKSQAKANYFKTIIKSLAREPIAKTIQIPVVRKEIQRIEKTNKKAKKIFKKISVVISKIVLVDGTKTKAQLSNFFGYYFYPEINYALTLEFFGNYYHLNIGKNPWKKTPNKVHIGEMLIKYGGGGHKDVGGFERKSKGEIMKITEEIIEYLNKHG